VAKAKKAKPKRTKKAVKAKPKAAKRAPAKTKVKAKAKPAARAKAKAPAKAKAKAPAKAKANAKTAVAKPPATPAPKPKATPKPKPPAPESLSLETIVLATPDRVYTAWLDGTEHSAFTGGEAIIEAVVGGKHSAWSGYIEGRFVELDPGRRIVMTWRTTEFSESDPDSRAEVRFSPDGGGTRVEIEHTELPPGGAQKYGTGWREFYFVPMRRYFESDAPRE
jgi:uncharacterized protein YndB with AHSA1/START domain